jgi:hypothetical protein
MERQIPRLTNGRRNTAAANLFPFMQTKPTTPKPAGGTRPARLKPGHYWAAIWPNGRQLWGDTVKRNVERAARGTGLRIVQIPQ